MNRDGRTALATSLVLLIGGLVFFVCFAGLYPQLVNDEVFFNFPAISLLKGHGFFCPVSSHAPYAKTLWAYHAPFFPHLQVLTFWLLGISQQVSRLPNLIGGYSAACLMGFLLMRQRYTVAPLIFALVWLGDRGMQELQTARMDGIALLLVVLGFMMLNRFYVEPNLRIAFCVAFFTASAMGFHPVAGSFFVLSAIVLFTIAYKRKCLPQSLIGYGLGILAVAIAVLSLVQFHPIEALQQFMWWFQIVTDSTTISGKWDDLVGSIRWSKWFLFALAGFTLLVALPIAFSELGKLRRGPIEHRSFFRLSLALFCLAGIVCLINRGVYPYYIIYFSLWPIALLASEAEQRLLLKRPQVLAIAVAAILMVAWLPGAAWNALRIREEVLYRTQLAHGYILAQLKQSVPANARVSGDPYVYMLAEEANLDFTPVPWQAHSDPSDRVPIPPDEWLLVTEDEYTNPTYFFASDVRSRSVAFCENAFPGAKRLDFDVCLLRPLGK
jgi:hypothetical protein